VSNKIAKNNKKTDIHETAGRYRKLWKAVVKERNELAFDVEQLKKERDNRDKQITLLEHNMAIFGATGNFLRSQIISLKDEIDDLKAQNRELRDANEAIDDHLYTHHCDESEDEQDSENINPDTGLNDAKVGLINNVHGIRV